MKYYLIAAIIAVGIILGVVIYTNGVNARQDKAIEWERKQKVADYTYRLNCEQDAFNNYTTSWVNECKTRELKDTCSLPMVNANALNAALKADKDRCTK